MWGLLLVVKMLTHPIPPGGQNIVWVMWWLGLDKDKTKTKKRQDKTLEEKTREVISTIGVRKTGEGEGRQVKEKKEDNSSYSETPTHRCLYCNFV